MWGYCCNGGVLLLICLGNFICWTVYYLTALFHVLVQLSVYLHICLMNLLKRCAHKVVGRLFYSSDHEFYCSCTTYPCVYRRQFSLHDCVISSYLGCVSLCSSTWQHDIAIDATVRAWLYLDVILFFRTTVLGVGPLLLGTVPSLLRPFPGQNSRISKQDFLWSVFDGSNLTVLFTKILPFNSKSFPSMVDWRHNQSVVFLNKSFGNVLLAFYADT